jgi:hypothetical protein
MKNPIYIHLYFNPNQVRDYLNNEIDEMHGYTKETKGSTDTVHLSIPLERALECGEEVFLIKRPLLGGI